MSIDLKSAPTLREIVDRSWMEHASCRGVDTESWFHPKPPKFVRRQIDEICSSCPMSRLCLSFGLVNNEEFGAWGGYVASELQPLRRRLASGEPLASLLEVPLQESELSQGSDAA
jgi:hypothetical protein